VTEAPALDVAVAPGRPGVQADAFAVPGSLATIVHYMVSRHRTEVYSFNDKAKSIEPRSNELLYHERRTYRWQN